MSNLIMAPQRETRNSIAHDNLQTHSLNQRFYAEMIGRFPF